MARYQPYDVDQVTLIPVLFKDQILPGSFEYALNEIVDQHIDLGPFESRYSNDDEKHQIIVNAEAHGEGQEAHLLGLMLESTREGLKTAKGDQNTAT